MALTSSPEVDQYRLNDQPISLIDISLKDSAIANIMRSGNKWDDNELKYNIGVAFKDAQTFSGKIPLPAPC
jgi:hypothetical protein